jgi:hypothetical protein
MLNAIECRRIQMLAGGREQVYMCGPAESRSVRRTLSRNHLRDGTVLAMSPRGSIDRALNACSTPRAGAGSLSIADGAAVRT